MSDDGGERGSILLPVLLLLLLLATAATAMTLQAQTSLREAATRRDRFLLGVAADGATRGVALALAQASAARTAPPFPVDGTPQTCRFADGRRLWIAVQDTGGLIDLNKAKPELLTEILTRIGIGGSDAAALTKAILAHRGSDTPSSPRVGPTDRRAAARSRPDARTFLAAEEVGDLPGMTPYLFQQLGPMITIASGSSGIDPQVAAPGIRAIIPPKELASPAFESMTSPSAHNGFAIEIVVASRSGQRFAREALFRLDPDAGPMGRFATWESRPLAGIPSGAGPSALCQGLAAALAAA